LAKTILQNRYGITEQQAYLRLQRASRSRRVSLGELAAKVVGENGHPVDHSRIA
jgi:AmiR/NasT family two-component response regulator